MKIVLIHVFGYHDTIKHLSVIIHFQELVTLKDYD